MKSVLFIPPVFWWTNLTIGFKLTYAGLFQSAKPLRPALRGN